MMTPSALVAIATLTGEPCYPCKRDGIVYAVSRSWVVWGESKQRWKAVYRPTCTLRSSWSLDDLLKTEMRHRCPWTQYDVESVNLDALRKLSASSGYTTKDVAVRLGYSPSNNEVRRILTGNRPVTVQFAQRAVAAFGRGVLGVQS